MEAALGRVSGNLEQAGRLAEEAFASGAHWVILPEFFTSAMGFSPDMEGAARPLHGEPVRFLETLAKRHKGTIGGSCLAVRDGECYNTFVLVQPDGTKHFHDKDQPTMWENCYYVGGTDSGVLDTGALKAGVALCWEFVRTRTVRRLRGRVNLVVGGSCWWDLPRMRLPGFGPDVSRRNRRIMYETPGEFARLVGAPVVHAAHAGTFSGKMPWLPGFPYRSNFLGETQITDANGNILARRTMQEGAGIILADIKPAMVPSPTAEVPPRFWVPDLPGQIRFAWIYQNLHGRRYYRKHTRKRLARDFS